MFLMLPLLSHFVFRRALAARDRLAAAFLIYYTRAHYRDGGSDFIGRWTAHFVSRGVPRGGHCALPHG